MCYSIVFAIKTGLNLHAVAKHLDMKDVQVEGLEDTD